MLLQQFYNLRPRPRRVVPDPNQKRQVELLTAALGHVRPSIFPVSQRALQHPPGADRARAVVTAQQFDELARGCAERAVASVDDADRALPLGLGERDDGELAAALLV